MPYYKSDKFSDMLAEQSSNDYQNRYHANDMKTRSVRTSKSNENFLKTFNYPQQTIVINAQNNSINFQTSQYHHIQETSESLEMINSTDLQADQPYKPWSFEQFDESPTQSTTTLSDYEKKRIKYKQEQRKKQLSNMSPSRRRAEYENHNKYIQIHNKFQSVRLKAERGRLVPFNREISKFSIFAQSFSDDYNGKSGVLLQNIGNCDYMCVRDSGRVYTSDKLVDECLFSTALQLHDITDSVKFVSLAHSNSTHSLYIRLEPGKKGKVSGIYIANNKLNTTKEKAEEHRRDWILLPVSFNQLTQVFRKKKGEIPFVADRWGLQNVYCPKIIRKNQETKDKQRCIKMRRKKNTVNLCTSKEKKLWKQFNQKWPWNTRNCSSLKPRKKKKQCKKEKRLRGCVEKHLKKKKGYGKKKAWLICIQKLKFVRYKF